MDAALLHPPQGALVVPRDVHHGLLLLKLSHAFGQVLLQDPVYQGVPLHGLLLRLQDHCSPDGLHQEAFHLVVLSHTVDVVHLVNSPLRRAVGIVGVHHGVVRRGDLLDDPQVDQLPRGPEEPQQVEVRGAAPLRAVARGQVWERVRVFEAGAHLERGGLDWLEGLQDAGGAANHLCMVPGCDLDPLERIRTEFRGGPLLHLQVVVRDQLGQRLADVQRVPQRHLRHELPQLDWNPLLGHAEVIADVLLDEAVLGETLEAKVGVVLQGVLHRGAALVALLDHDQPCYLRILFDEGKYLRRQSPEDLQVSGCGLPEQARAVCEQQHDKYWSFLR
mmetsp:Transcript_15036/g.39769  ORF Transcript_15036/g.39769 Transcript_15036/m.39769 type:complete len:333 (+) Transcript_15036:1-999(+)